MEEVCTLVVLKILPNNTLASQHPSISKQQLFISHYDNKALPHVLKNSSLRFRSNFSWASTEIPLGLRLLGSTFITVLIRMLIVWWRRVLNWAFWCCRFVGSTLFFRKGKKKKTDHWAQNFLLPTRHPILDEQPSFEFQIIYSQLKHFWAGNSIYMVKL